MEDFIGKGNYDNKLKEEQENAKKWMKIIVISLIILLFLAIFLVILKNYIEATELKVFINNEKNNKLKSIFVLDNGKVYVPIRKFAEYVGFESSNGDYREYSEDTTKCHVKSINEVASATMGSNIIYKLLLENENDYESFEINEPIRMMNTELYTTADGAKILFNVLMNYDQERNQITIYTLPYLVNYYTEKTLNTGISDKDASFSNQKALLYDMLVVKNANGNYGVTNVNGTEIIGSKYNNLKFIESTKEFIVTTPENKVGILSTKNVSSNNVTVSTKITPKFDDIKQMDKNAGLYIVSNNGKYGVINSQESEIVYIENDQIGVDISKFKNSNIKNPYLFYENCIPVKKDNKWKLYDINGAEILFTYKKQTGEKVSISKIYDEIGCTRVTDKNSSGVLLIPQYNAIAVNESGKYGIIDKQGNVLCQNILDEVYSKVEGGKEQYYIKSGVTLWNIDDYVKKYVKNETYSQNVNTKNNNTESTNQLVQNTAPTQSNTNNVVQNTTKEVSNTETNLISTNTTENVNSSNTQTKIESNNVSQVNNQQ